MQEIFGTKQTIEGPAQGVILISYHLKVAMEMNCSVDSVEIKHDQGYVALNLYCS